jgi:hypothetical protein
VKLIGFWQATVRRDRRSIESLLLVRGQGDVHGLFNHLLLSGFAAPSG